MHERRCRRDLQICGSFCLVGLVAPALFTEAYPFSAVPVFVDAPTQFCDYVALAPNGARVPLEALALQRNYWGLPSRLPTGTKPPPTFDEFGTVPTEAAVRAHVAERLVAYPEVPFVTVLQRVVGARDDGRVGVIEQRKIVVENPTSPQRR